MARSNPKMCRVCLGTKELSNIFQNNSSMQISQKIMYFAKVEIYLDDGLPDMICLQCIERLNECYKFKIECEQSDFKLRNLYKESFDREDFNIGIDLGSMEENELDLLHKDLEETKNRDFDLEKVEEKYLISDDLKPKIHLDENLVKDECKTNIALLDNDCNRIKREKKVRKSIKPQKEQCFTCGKVMSSRFRLKMHLRTHTGEKPFSCLYCKKTFTLEQNLKVHMRVHTGEKPLHCNTCGAAFAQSSGLAAHIRKHTGELPYCCSLCPKRFRTTGHLQYHIRRHTGEKNFECEKCGRAFITRSDLKQHSLTHTGEKPYICCVCSLQVTRASHLRRHMIVHNENRSFACKLCPSSFLKRCDLEKHRRKHNSKKS